MAVSSAIWQVKLVTDSLGNSACAESGHPQTFKHQTCCLGWFNRMRLWTLRSREGQISMTCWNDLCHATQIVCFAGLAFIICSMAVKGSLVISRPSSMVPTKVVPHASPAISITDMIWVSTKQSVWTLRNFGLYSRIFTFVRKKLYKQLCTKNQKKYVIRDDFWQTCTNWKPQSSDIAISSAIWQVKLVTDSLGNSACAESGHRQTFKHQTCCLGWFNRMRLWTLRSRGSDIDDMLKWSLSRHTNCLLRRLCICHLVNGCQWVTCHLPAFFNGSDKGGATCKSCNFNHWYDMGKYKTICLITQKLWPVL